MTTRQLILTAVGRYVIECALQPHILQLLSQTGGADTII